VRPSPSEPTAEPLPSPAPTLNIVGRIDEERLTTPIELFWDLVFVFAVTQVSTLLARDLSWAGFGRSMLVLALVWWAWSAIVWAANAQAPNSSTLRATLLVATVLIFVVGLAIPHAFGSESTLFAATYAGVRFMHLGLYADASRRGQARWSSIAGFALTVAIGMVMLIVGSFLGGWHRIAIWALAAAIDYAGPAWLTRERLRGIQQVAVAHFSERYGLFVIICLGESILAIGAGVAGQPLDAATVATVAGGLVVTLALWWTYFDRFAATAAQRLREHDDPVLAAADAYSYLHLVIVAGIIVFAVGMRLATEGVAEPLSDAARLALCGGLGGYLIGHAAFRLRLVGELDVDKLLAAALLLILFAAGGDVAAWGVTSLAAGVLTALCAHETWLRPALARSA
jgi:low temperature requirement protein LtrA